jgi:hypothetical protein
LQDHLLLFGIKISASNLSERRQATPWAVFTELMKLFLKPVADPERHPEAFYAGLRLVAIDATEFSMQNTEQINEQFDKAKSRRDKAAFAKLRCSALVELLTHNPLAVRVGREGESEWALSTDLVEEVPRKSLVLADRLYGCAVFVWLLMKVLEGKGSWRWRCGIRRIEMRSLRRSESGRSWRERSGKG